MKLKRTIIAPVLVAGVALVSGGWLLQRGVAQQENVYQRARIFDEVLHYISDRYVEPHSSAQLYEMAIEGMIRELGDPHTTYMTAEEYADLRIQTSGEYAGVGMQIAEKDGWVTVIAPLPETPAERAGVKAGDRIVEIEGQSTEGWTSDDAVKVLRGRKGEPVNFRVVRFGVDEPISFRVVRDEIQLKSVPYAYMLGDGVGYVRLSVFSETSTQELQASVARLRGEGMRRLVLDLRGNPGGLLDQGVGVSDLFLGRGQTIVETRTRDPRETETARATRGEVFPGLPMVVLVDQYSASAAEIVAGALQDHDRALVVGTTTFGKGSVQSLLPLSGGNFLKMTTGRWYTPVGRSIQKEKQRQGDPTALVQDVPISEEGVPVEEDTIPRKPYRTDSGRTVFGGGGIVPDLILKPDTFSTAEQEFFKVAAKGGSKFSDVIFSYAIEYGRKHPGLSPQFDVTPAMRREFFERLRTAGLEVTWEQFEGARDFINRELAEEITAHKFGAPAAARRSNLEDRVVQGAVELLRAAENQPALFRLAEARTKLTRS